MIMNYIDLSINVKKIVFRTSNDEIIKLIDEYIKTVKKEGKK